MKIIKVLFVFAIISLIAVSCKETKKEEVNESVEVTETEMKVESAESTVAVEENTEAGNVSKDAKSTEKAIETETKGVDVPEGLLVETMAETPVIYPGCEGTHDEIRACSIKKFKKFIVKNFNSDLASELRMKDGDHKIKAIVKINAGGKASIVRVDASNESLEKEVVRVIDKLPVLTAATKNGSPVDVYFVLPVNFKVDNY